MVDVQYPVETCLYCGQNRHIREAELRAQTLDEVKNEIISQQIGKYRICEECLEFLDRMLQCNLNLREQADKAQASSVIPIAQIKPVEPEIKEDVEEPKPQPKTGAIFPDYRQFVIIKKAEDMVNYPGWDLLKIIKKAEQYTEYGFPQKIVKPASGPSASIQYASAATGGINGYYTTVPNMGNGWVEADTNKDNTERVFPIKRKVTHYLLGQSGDKAIEQLTARVVIAENHIEGDKIQIEMLAEQNKALKDKNAELSVAAKNLLSLNTDLENKCHELTERCAAVDQEIQVAIEKNKELNQRLVDNGMVRNIELGDSR